MVKTWEMALGLGAACAACCALPLLGVAGGMAALGSGLWAHTEGFVLVAGVLVATALAVLGAWWWRARQAARQSSCDCGTSCRAGAVGPAKCGPE